MAYPYIVTGDGIKQVSGDFNIVKADWPTNQCMYTKGMLLLITGCSKLWKIYNLLQSFHFLLVILIKISHMNVYILKMFTFIIFYTVQVS